MDRERKETSLEAQVFALLLEARRALTTAEAFAQGEEERGFYRSWKELTATYAHQTVADPLFEELRLTDERVRAIIERHDGEPYPLEAAQRSRFRAKMRQLCVEQVHPLDMTLDSDGPLRGPLLSVAAVTMYAGSQTSELAQLVTCRHEVGKTQRAFYGRSERVGRQEARDERNERKEGKVYSSSSSATPALLPSSPAAR